MFQDEALRELGTVVITPEREVEPGWSDVTGDEAADGVRKTAALEGEREMAAWDDGALSLSAVGRRRGLDDDDEGEEFYDFDDEEDDDEEDDDFYDDDDFDDDDDDDGDFEELDDDD
jgi:hypothetical protein